MNYRLIISMLKFVKNKKSEKKIGIKKNIFLRLN
jgi:hypothetical protein